nr:IS1634 family transposase [Actinomyces naeslundii]
MTPSPPGGARRASGTRAASPSRCGTRALTRVRGERYGATPRSERPGTTTRWTPRRTGPGPSVAGEKRPKGTRFVTVHQGDQVLDEASIARARRLAGLKGYVTNIPSRLMDAGEVVSSYHELWHVEASFRMSKHDLRARPVFHHTRDAIEAHLTVVMAALAVARYLQEATGISIARIVRELRGLQEVTINLNGHHLAAAPRLTDTADDILTALSTPPPAH